MNARNGRNGHTAAARGRPGPINPILDGPGEYPSMALERVQRTLVPFGTRIIQFGMGDLADETPEIIRAALRTGITPVATDPATTGRPGVQAAA